MAYYYLSSAQEQSVYTYDGYYVPYLKKEYCGPFRTEAECAEEAANYGLREFEVLEFE